VSLPFPRPQVQSLHTHSMSLSNGVKATPSIGISPLVGPAHTRSDSLPAEAYLGDSSQSSSRHSTTSSSPPPPIPGLSHSTSHTSIGRGQSPLIHRKMSPAPQPSASGDLYQKQRSDSTNLIRSITSPVLPYVVRTTMRSDSASPVQYHQAPRGHYNSMEHINDTLAYPIGCSPPPRPLSANYQQHPLEVHDL